MSAPAPTELIRMVRLPPRGVAGIFAIPALLARLSQIPFGWFLVEAFYPCQHIKGFPLLLHELIPMT